MGRLFKARWPMLARAEMLLLLAAGLVSFHKVLAVIPAVSDLAWFEADALGVSPAVLTWGFMVFMLAGPLLGAMVLADRMLATRRGFAVLSVLAVAAWTGFAVVFSGDIRAVLPAGWRFGPGPVPFIATAALLLHAWPFRAGPSFIGSGSQASAPAGPKRRNSTALAAVIIGATLSGLVAAVIHAFSGPPPSIEPWALVPERPVVLGRRPTLPLPPPIAAGGEASAIRQRDGSFVFQVLISDRSVPMVFDTGATRVTLRAEDAERLGIPIDDLVYSGRLRTANGIAAMAPVTLGRMSVGSITVENVPALVAHQGLLQASLLGQSFLGRLKSYDVQSNRVTLHGH